MPHDGQCLCGDIKLYIASTHFDQDLCACVNCRHATGTAVGCARVTVKLEDLTIAGTPQTFIYPGINIMSGSAGEEIEAEIEVTRTFCGTCGSPITTTSDKLAGSTLVHTGNFHDFGHIPFNVTMKSSHGRGVFAAWKQLSSYSGSLP